MHILFDSLSTQVQVHRRLNIRLNTLLGAIQSEGWTYAFSRDPITTGQLHDCDVLAILTRHQVGFDDATNPNPSATSAYTYDPLAEIPAIRNFVSGGGGLLLISNHGPAGTRSPDDTVNDLVLANAFNVVIKPAHFAPPAPAKLLSMTAANSLNGALSDGVLFQVSEIASHNSCAIHGGAGLTFTSIAKIPSNAVDTSGNNMSPNNQHFAIRLHHGSGKVIVAGNSGIAGDDGCTNPAPGTIVYANNLLFLVNCFKELGGITPGF
jgi:hypothetical protein